jgi:hypothetical protein
MSIIPTINKAFTARVNQEDRTLEVQWDFASLTGDPAHIIKRNCNKAQMMEITGKGQPMAASAREMFLTEADIATVQGWLSEGAKA